MEFSNGEPVAHLARDNALFAFIVMRDEVTDLLHRLSAIAPIARIQKQARKIVRTEISVEHS